MAVRVVAGKVFFKGKIADKGFLALRRLRSELHVDCFYSIRFDCVQIVEDSLAELHLLLLIILDLSSIASS